mmetsp:Transcript_9667/g.20058  ORF Transcript_9667/g.20058 Transcript_9667/m.20058 type:complete len:237 (-) Transcript_9667:842-1552(-)
MGEMTKSAARAPRVWREELSPTKSASMFLFTAGTSLSRMDRYRRRSVAVHMSRCGCGNSTMCLASFSCSTGMNRAPEGVDALRRYWACACPARPRAMPAATPPKSAQSSSFTASSKSSRSSSGYSTANTNRYTTHASARRISAFSFSRTHPMVHTTAAPGVSFLSGMKMWCCAAGTAGSLGSASASSSGSASGGKAAGYTARTPSSCCALCACSVAAAKPTLFALPPRMVVAVEAW